MTSHSGHHSPHRDQIAAELEKLTPIAEFRGLEVYRFSGNDCPAALVEIGRLREKGFRAIGSGRGVECDLDHLDTGENAYYQLVAWDPGEKEMVAIYRYQPGSRGMGDGKGNGSGNGDGDGKANGDEDGKANGDEDGKANGDEDGKANGDEDGKANGDEDGKGMRGGASDGAGEVAGKLRTATLFDFSATFREKLLPHAIELGRSVVNPSAKRQRFGFFAIWKGLGALLVIHPETRYFFGTVSLHTHMNPDAVNCLISYLQHHYPPPESMLKAREEIAYHPRPEKAGISGAVEQGDPDTPEKRIKKLTNLMAEHGDTVPMILKSYMGLTNNIWFDGSVIDRDFGDAHIIGLIVPIENIHPEFRKQFM